MICQHLIVISRELPIIDYLLVGGGMPLTVSPISNGDVHHTIGQGLVLIYRINPFISVNMPCKH